MKQSFITKISHINQILFFLCISIFIVAVSYTFFSEIFRDYDYPSGPAVVEMAAENPVELKSELAHVVYGKNTHVFGVKSNVIQPSQKAGQVLDMFSGGGERYFLVNLIFYNEAEKRKLFEKDVYIQEFWKSEVFSADWRKSYQVLPGAFNLYLVVSEDTNQDGVLSYKDQQKLFVSNWDGMDLEHVVSNVIEITLISEELMLIQTKVKDKFEYQTFNLDSKVIEKIKLSH